MLDDVLGRMDKHIELSYCGFEAFKVLANNYLNFEEHESFETIKRLLEETKMTPADVAENLMPKLRGEERERCLMRLVKALEDAEKEARHKAEEEEKIKAAAKEEEDKKKINAVKKEVEKQDATVADKAMATTNSITNIGLVKENGAAKNGA